MYKELAFFSVAGRYILDDPFKGVHLVQLEKKKDRMWI